MSTPPPITRRAVLGAGMASLAGLACPPVARAGGPPPPPPPRPMTSTVARAEAPAPLSLQAVSEGLMRELAPAGTTAFALADAQTGALLAAHRANTAMPPASVAKIVTAAYAQASLGAGHRFSTRLLGLGPVSGGVLAGDLVLAGSGDPTLDTDRLATLAAGLRAAGVRGISGRFCYHEGPFPALARIAPDQPVHAGYNPGLSGLNLNFNRVHFEWERRDNDYVTTFQARGRQFRPDAVTTQMRIVERGAPVYTYAQDGTGQERWTVARSALGRDGARWLPVRAPAPYCAATFRALAAEQGLALPPPEPLAALPAAPTAGELAATQSAALPEILHAMLRYSTNLTAEAVGLAASQARGLAPLAGLAASGGAMARWAEGGLGLAGARFDDHSGLNDGSRLQPGALVGALCQMGPDGAVAGLLKEIALRDNAARDLRAKTGTLHFVSGLAGFFTAPGGRRLAFATFSADLESRARITEATRENPPGARRWRNRARHLQFQLVDLWARQLSA